ncbi:hypothetical protein GWK47_018034 [Chionoecetes opilio]|uniref:Uncharacterized protein n=1 Tax=Chionoecetes opilio TaxID=41210 RepID=A0A8J4XZW0_CHIOP|nr:hypothetical protein GWK47_018034 [Chionoecetes opilio]
MSVMTISGNKRSSVTTAPPVHFMAYASAPTLQAYGSRRGGGWSWRQVTMVWSSKENFRHMQHAVHYARTGSHADSVKPEEKSGIRKLAAKFFLEAPFTQFHNGVTREAPTCSVAAPSWSWLWVHLTP